MISYSPRATSQESLDVLTEDPNVSASPNATMRQYPTTAPTPDSLRPRPKFRGSLFHCENPSGRSLTGPNLSCIVFGFHCPCFPRQLVHFSSAMKMIRTCEFARMAGIRPETAWRIATSGTLSSAKRNGKLWRISYSDAKKWIASRAPQNSITPESAAKIIGCSGAHVRNLLAKSKLPFAQQRPNRRWALRDSEEFQAWVLRQKQILGLKKNSPSDIDLYPGQREADKILTEWMRWETRVGGEKRILSWPDNVLRPFVNNMQSMRDLVNRAEKICRAN